MYKVNFYNNGQWSFRSLEKSWTDDDMNNIAEWADTGKRDWLNKVPAAKGDLRNKMLDHLQGHGEHRVNKDGKKEYKLYRSGHVKDHEMHDKAKTSWSVDPGFTDHWASILNGIPETVISPFTLIELTKTNRFTPFSAA